MSEAELNEPGVDALHTECLLALRHVREGYRRLREHAAAWDLVSVPSGWRGLRPSILAYRQEELEAIDRELR